MINKVLGQKEISIFATPLLVIDDNTRGLVLYKAATFHLRLQSVPRSFVHTLFFFQHIVNFLATAIVYY